MAPISNRWRCRRRWSASSHSARRWSSSRGRSISRWARSWPAAPSSPPTGCRSTPAAAWGSCSRSAARSGSRWARATRLLVVAARIPAIVATLGTLAIYRGGGHRVRGRAADLGDGAAGLLSGDRAGARAARAAAGLDRGRADPRVRLGGVGTRAPGATSTRSAAIPRARASSASARAGIWRLVFVLSGLLCGFVGVLWGARFGTVDAVLAPDLHFQAISAVVVGGV